MLSLRLRIIVSYLLLAVVALLAFGLYVSGRVDEDFRHDIEDDLLAEATMVKNALQPLLANEADAIEYHRLVKRLGAGTGVRITLIAADGRVLGDSDDTPALLENQAARAEVRDALAAGEGRSRSEAANVRFSHVAVRADLAGRDPVIVRVSRSTELVDDALNRIRDSLTVALVAVVAVAVLFGALVSRSLLRPLGGIAAAATALATGDLSARVRPRPGGEVGHVADAFNQMAATVQEQMTAAAQERSRLTAALNSSVDAVIAVDAESKVLFANVAAERLFQRASTEIVDAPFVWTLADDKVVEAIKASRDASESNVALIERPGRQFLQVVTTSIRGGGDWAVLVVFHDLTDVRRSEQMRRDFVANVSHELRTPLAGIKSVVETLAEGAIEDPEVAKDFLARADSEVDRLVQMVEELLELSRIETGDLPLSVEPADVMALLGDVTERMRPQAERKRTALTLTPEDGLDRVRMDRRRIEHSVVNLVHNAIKFTPEGGSVTVGATRAADALLITVNDTGVGIAPAERPRIFERFYKADQSHASGGSGLGLAVVKHTAEAHGGSVSVESELGQGAAFTISIPIL